MASRPPLSTPKTRHYQEADTPRKARFFHAIDQARDSGKSITKVLKEEHINRDTNYRWLRQRPDIGARRAEKARSGRPRKVTEEQLQMLVNPDTNSVRDQILDCQIEYHQLPYATRTLQRACKAHKPPILMGKQPKVKQLRQPNKSGRVEYGETHKNDTVESFWQYVIFTDEAHVDPGQMNRQHVLREEGTRYRPDNMQEMPSLQEVKLHMAGSISWHHKGQLTFYHDKEDVPSIEKKPKTRKPRHRKVETDEQYQNRFREWKSKQPHEAEVKQKGNSMTNKYYTDNLLPIVI